jgi:UTP--glucose-1-phosphate uridylyltransferase
MKRVAVILAAGIGGRFMPAAKSVNKCLLPLGAKPTIQYVVEDCVDAGITDIIVVVPVGDAQIRGHFSRDVELEQSLKDTHKADVYERDVAPVERLGEYVRFVECSYADGKRGTLIPFQAALPHIANDVEEIFVAVGDCIVARKPKVIGEFKAALATPREPGEGVLLGFGVTLEERTRYGAFIQRDENSRKYAERIIEKPSVDVSPESRSANTSFYLLPRAITAYVDKVVADPRSGEYYLTDAVSMMLSEYPCVIHEIEGKYLDSGNPQLYLEANQHIAEITR